MTDSSCNGYEFATDLEERVMTSGIYFAVYILFIVVQLAPLWHKQNHRVAKALESLDRSDRRSDRRRVSPTGDDASMNLKKPEAGRHKHNELVDILIRSKTYDEHKDKIFSWVDELRKYLMSPTVPKGSEVRVWGALLPGVPYAAILYYMPIPHSLPQAVPSFSLAVSDGHGSFIRFYRTRWDYTGGFQAGAAEGRVRGS